MVVRYKIKDIQIMVQFFLLSEDKKNLVILDIPFYVKIFLTKL